MVEANVGVGQGAVAAQAARDHVVAVPSSDRTGIIVRGKDRVTWLNGLVTCELAKLAPLDGAYGLLVEKKGRIQTDFFVVPAADKDTLALLVPRDLQAALIETLDHYLIMEDAELEATDLSVWQLHGPAGMDVATALAAPFAGSIDLLGFGGGVVAAHAAHADAFAERLRTLVEARGGTVADERAFDAVWIERGVPRFGVEVDATLYPQEAALERRAVSFDKGCYLGQEVVYMLENRGHVKRKLVPLDVDGDSVLTAGEPLTTSDGLAVGDVRSAAIGPSSGRSVAIAMVKWAQAKPGTELRAGEHVVRVRA